MPIVSVDEFLQIHRDQADVTNELYSCRFLLYLTCCPKRDRFLSKTVLSKIRPKQANKWIGDTRDSIIELFFDILT